jgi:hypothetical protein
MTFVKTKNGTNRNGNFRLFALFAANVKQKRQTFTCLVKTENENRSFFFLGLLMING